MTDAVRLRVIDRGATPEEVAAIVAAVTSLAQQQRRAVAGPPPTGLDAWVQASRLASRRIGLQRGPWRLSGRLVRRSRV